MAARIAGLSETQRVKLATDYLEKLRVPVHEETRAALKALAVQVPQLDEHDSNETIKQAA